MARIIPDDVKQILSTTLGDTAIETYITAANLTITDLLGSSTLSDAQLTSIELFFCAHLIASTRERQASKEQIGQASITYDGQTKTRLDSTLYGQNCLLLDSTGILAKANMGLRQASIYAVVSFDESDEDE